MKMHRPTETFAPRGLHRSDWWNAHRRFFHGLSQAKNDCRLDALGRSDLFLLNIHGQIPRLTPRYSWDSEITPSAELEAAQLQLFWKPSEAETLSRP